jgi:hypothetical protein
MEEMDEGDNNEVNESKAKGKFSKKLYAYDFVCTVIFPAGEDGYEAVFGNVIAQAEKMLNENLIIQAGENDTIPIRFSFSKISEVEMGAVIKAGDHGILLMPKKALDTLYKEKEEKVILPDSPVLPIN